LCANDIFRHRMDGGDRDGVLGGDSGDRAGPKHAELVKRLKVRLNAGAAA
jgi:hypothetical protein